MKLSIVLLAVCLAAVSAWETPSFCKRDECPEYTVIEANEDYEIREYKASKWVATGYRATDTETKSSESSDAFMRLFQYISGNNVEEAEIDMTRPVRTRVANCDVTDCSKQTHMQGFYIPQEHAANPPAPVSSDVQIIEIPSTRYYVRSFSGYKYERAFNFQLRLLKQAIGNEAAYDNSYHVMAGYNSPFELFNRHNEVMLEVTSQKEAAKKV